MKEGILPWLRRASLLLSFLPWLALLGWLSAVAWFLCDDAFISFRYARNLLEGHGLVFNPGEYVEGYTNFLWILELAALWKVLGIPPEQAAPWLSAACTVGVVAALGLWFARLPLLRHRRLTAWMAFGLLCSSATFAVWTSGGGLETRQFTLFLVVAVVCLSLWRDRRRGLAAASLSLASAALVRPEGLLTGLVCISWFAVQSMADAGRSEPGWRRLRTASPTAYQAAPARSGWRRPDWRRLAWLAAPFVALVAAHYLFRHAYYGEWLPNTYYAKHVRPWYESGFRYLWAAALETGLYLLLPLAAVAARHRWRAHRDGVFALPLLLAGVHMAYVMRVGGDHFEYRPLDFYWPLLALPAAAGIVHLGCCPGSRLAAGRWRARLPGPGVMGARACAVAVFVPVLFYAGAIQGVLLFEGAATQERIFKQHIALNDDNAGWLLRVPGMPMLVAISNELRRLAAPQLVATRFAEHRNFARLRFQWYKAYERMERGVIPPDALAAHGALGIQSYYLPDLNVIDTGGLTDAAIARNPVARANHERVMAHDRRPPKGYLGKRGVNFIVHPAVNDPSKVPPGARYAVQFGQDLWMPFGHPDEEWVFDRFAGRGLHVQGKRYAGLSWEEATPDFDYRLGDLGVVWMPRWYHWALVFARNCAPDELLAWPYPHGELDTTKLRRWTINETGLCRTHVMRAQGWMPDWPDSNTTGLKEVKRLNPAIRSVFDVHLLEDHLIYFRQPCMPVDDDARFFLHVVPVDERDLPSGRREHGFDNLDFRIEEHDRVGEVGERCVTMRRLPDYSIAEIRTGQFTDEGRLWQGAIVVAGAGNDEKAPGATAAAK